MSTNLVTSHGIALSPRRSSATRVTHYLLAALSALALLVTAAACDTQTESKKHNTKPGTLVSSTSIGKMSTTQLGQYIKEFGLESSQPQYAITAYRIVYQTIDPVGKTTTASGLVVLPQNREHQLKPVTWLHGTTVYKGEAASVNKESSDRAAAFLLASDGYAVSAPDYLGLGVGPGVHPYDDIDSTVTASMDALQATRTLVKRQDRELTDKVLVSGFSQGGNATMAVGRALQEGVDPYFSLGALAPMGGPFHVSGTLATAVSSGIENVTAYLAYLTVAWNRLHHFYDSPSEAFKAPYDKTIEELFNNRHPAEEVLSGLPATLEELFTPEFLDYLKNPTGALAQALAKADTVCDWRPEVPVNIYTASGDQDVPIANAYHCQQQLEGHGAQVRIVDFGGEVDHAGTFSLGLPATLENFRQL